MHWGIMQHENKLKILSKLIKFTWKIRNRPNRKKDQISDFSDIYFSSYGNFCGVITPNFWWIFHNISKIKNRRIFVLFFLFYSAHCASFMKVGSKLRGGVCLSLIGTEPNWFEVWTYKKWWKIWCNYYFFLQL